MIENLNINDIKIMRGFLLGIDFNKPYGKLKGVSISDLIDKTKFSHTKIRNTIKFFIEKGYANEGLKKGNAKTYYLTQKAFDIIRELGTCGEE